MKEQAKIPVSKVRRASKFVRTGLKVGGNYIKHYSSKLVNKDIDESKLNERNAEDIYETLSELKGSALKVAQMLSMDRGMLPSAFAKKFSEAQHKAPPLSGPLIVKTFQQYFGKSPLKLYDAFDMEAAHAASIGQVHRAEKDGEVLAVKIQYPGVKDSVSSDLNMVRPFARRLFGWKDKDMEIYFDEIKERLLEETDYKLELSRSLLLSEKCKDLPHIHFAKYYPEYSSDKIITMKWMEGKHMDEFLEENPSQEIRNQIGQALWDFYNYQVHVLKIMHADAHPGNYLFRPDGSVVVIDFGCVKKIPEDFYVNYFQLLQPGILDNKDKFLDICKKTQIIYDFDGPKEVELYTSVFKEALEIVCQPFYVDSFDFGDEVYMDSIYEYGEHAGSMPELRNTKAPRGAKDGIYMNRTFFGLYSILNSLKAKVTTRKYIPTLEA